MYTASKKVIFFIPYLTGGGGERNVSHLSLNAPAHVQQIIVAFSGQFHYPHRAKIILLDIFPSRNFFVKCIIFIKAYIKFRRIVAKEKPDYVMSFGTMTGIINILASKNSIVRMGNPVVAGNESLFEKTYHFLVRMFFNKAKKIIVISKRAREELVREFNIKSDNIKVIYNFIDIDKTVALAKEPLDPVHQQIFKHPVIINVANLVGQKGQRQLILAFKLVLQKVKDAKLVIIGSGPMEKELKDLVKKLDIEKDVYFLGWQKNPFKFIAASAVFAMPSLWEGFGIAILEAMACRVPVVAFDCNFGPKEILAPEMDIVLPVEKLTYASSGVLLPLPVSLKEKNDNKDENALMAEALVEVLNNDSLKKNIVDSASKRVEYFNKESFLKGYEFLWE